MGDHAKQMRGAGMIWIGGQDLPVDFLGVSQPTGHLMLTAVIKSLVDCVGRHSGVTTFGIVRNVRVRLGGRVVKPRGVPENASAKADPTE